LKVGTRLYNSRDPDFVTQEPDFQTLDPDLQNRDPDFQTRNPKLQSRDPEFEIRNPGFISQDPDLQSQDPEIMKITRAALMGHHAGGRATCTDTFLTPVRTGRMYGSAYWPLGMRIASLLRLFDFTILEVCTRRYRALMGNTR